jgi:hypothetical protein
VSVAFLVDLRFFPAVWNEEVFVEGPAVRGGQNDPSTRFQAMLDSFEEFFKRGWIQVFEDLGEEDGVEVILRKGEAGVIVEIVIEQLDSGIADYGEAVGFEVNGAHVPPASLKIKREVTRPASDIKEARFFGANRLHCFRAEPESVLVISKVGLVLLEVFLNLVEDRVVHGFAA